MPLLYIVAQPILVSMYESFADHATVTFVMSHDHHLLPDEHEVMVVSTRGPGVVTLDEAILLN